MKIFYKSVLLLSIVSGLYLPVQAQASPVKPIGKVSAVTIKEQQVILTTDQNAKIEVDVYSPTIVRIRIDKQKLGDDFSYAVVSEPKQTKAAITQRNSELTITTDSLVTRISKDPFAVAFLTKNSRVINQDERGLTT